MYVKTLHWEPVAKYINCWGTVSRSWSTIAALQSRRHPGQGQKASGFDVLSLIFFIGPFDTRCYKVNFGWLTPPYWDVWFSSPFRHFLLIDFQYRTFQEGGRRLQQKPIEQRFPMAVQSPTQISFLGRRNKVWAAGGNLCLVQVWGGSSDYLP